MIDRFTRWSEAIPLQDCTADTAEDIFYSLDSQRFGAPCLITSDYWLGSQFEAQLFDALIKLGNSKRCRTTAYHPEFNGIIERWYCSLKTTLMCHSKTQWTYTLPIVLFRLRTCFKENLGTFVVKLIYGTTLEVSRKFFSSEEMPNDPRIFVKDFRVIMQKLRPRSTSHH